MSWDFAGKGGRITNIPWKTQQETMVLQLDLSCSFVMGSMVKASLPETREISGIMQGILEKISNAIDGTVILEDDSFYVLKRDGKKIDFSLEAEGLRKIGLLWKLIRNGLLEEGCSLLWDEPEANLNPEL